MTWSVYILLCGDNSLYTGITNNLEKRLQAHENGTGAKYTRGRRPFKLIYKETCSDRADASRKEAEIKALTREEKLMLAEPEPE